MEKRDLYDINRKLTGEYIYAGDTVPKDRYYLIVIIFIQNDNGDFLMQKRSLSKGNKWATTGGHPKMGESSLTGIYSEVKEELGIDISNYSSIKLFKSVKDDDCFIDFYYLNANIDITKLKLQEEEVESVQWYSLDEIENLIKNNQFHSTHIIPYRYCQEYLMIK